jgi:hypothetical protein
MGFPKILKYAVLHVLGVVLYIAAVAFLMRNAERLFGSNDSMLSAMAVLLTFVVSAAVMGMLVFGRPLVWYLDGAKKDGIMLACATISALVLAAAIIFLLFLL